MNTCTCTYKQVYMNVHIRKALCTCMCIMFAYVPQVYIRTYSLPHKCTQNSLTTSPTPTAIPTAPAYSALCTVRAIGKQFGFQNNYYENGACTYICIYTLFQNTHIVDRQPILTSQCTYHSRPKRQFKS